MKNWKTTIIGAVAGGLIAIQPLFATGSIDLTAVLTGFAVAFLGALSKDFDKSHTQ